MSYVTLGSRTEIGTADQTGLNPGNWTAAFTPDVINVNVPECEVYKIVVSGATNTTFNVYINRALWDVGVYGQLNSWDPSKQMLLRPGDSVYFCYSNPDTDNTPPTVTMWLRYDTGVQSVQIQPQGMG